MACFASLRASLSSATANRDMPLRATIINIFLSILFLLMDSVNLQCVIETVGNLTVTFSDSGIHFTRSSRTSFHNCPRHPHLLHIVEQIGIGALLDITYITTA